MSKKTLSGKYNWNITFTNDLLSLDRKYPLTSKHNLIEKNAQSRFLLRFLFIVILWGGNTFTKKIMFDKGIFNFNLPFLTTLTGRLKCPWNTMYWGFDIHTRVGVTIFELHSSDKICSNSESLGGGVVISELLLDPSVSLYNLYRITLVWLRVLGSNPKHWEPWTDQTYHKTGNCCLRSNLIKIE